MKKMKNEKNEKMMKKERKMKKIVNIVVMLSCGSTHNVSCVVCAGPPTASPFGHRCTVGVNRDPPVCHDVQGDIVTERQPVGCCCGGECGTDCCVGY